jgi:hypothetical protein
LRKEQERVFDRQASPMQKLRMLTHGNGQQSDSAGREIAALIESADFPARDQNASWAIRGAFERYPDETSSALVHRLEAGREIPFRTQDLLRTKGFIVCHQRTASLVGDEGMAHVASQYLVGKQPLHPARGEGRGQCQAHRRR